MANTAMRYAEPPPTEPRDHADFEAFIRDLDAGRIPPCEPDDARTEGADWSKS